MLEHMHLSSCDKSEMISILEANNYDVSNTGLDFFAMQKHSDQGLNRSGSVGRIVNHVRFAPAR